jgi:hypothetical protein
MWVYESLKSAGDPWVRWRELAHIRSSAEPVDTPGEQSTLAAGLG